MLGTIVLVVLLLVRPIGTVTLLHAYLLFACGVAMLAAIALVRKAAPERRRSGFDAALRRRPPADARPAELERVERAVTLGTGHAYDYHARLRPLLRDVASAQLAIGRGIDLDSPAGREALGDELWELLRADRKPPDNRFAPGIAPETLSTLLARLESL